MVRNDLRHAVYQICVGKCNCKMQLKLDAIRKSAASEARYGRQHEIAQMLGVSDALVANWIARRKTPTLKHGLKLLEFLKARRQHSKKKG